MRLRSVLVLIASLALVGCANMKNGEAKNGEEKEGDEVKMKFADVPAPVQVTLNRESNNTKIETVDKESDEGNTIYEADVMLNGTNWELRVAPDGKLISKKVDNEADEKKPEKKKDEDDEKDEKK